MLSAGTRCTVGLIRAVVHMFSEAEESPNIIVVRAGTLDGSAHVNVEALIWTSSAPPWAYSDPDIPHFENQPPAPKVDELS